MLPLSVIQVKVGTDARLGRMYEAEITDHVHNPEILVAGCGLHDLLGGRNLNEGRVFNFA